MRQDAAESLTFIKLAGEKGNNLLERHNKTLKSFHFFTTPMHRRNLTYPIPDPCPDPETYPKTLRIVLAHSTRRSLPKTKQTILCTASDLIQLEFQVAPSSST